MIFLYGVVTYPQTVADLLQKKTNCLSMCLSPIPLDDNLRLLPYVFSVNRGNLNNGLGCVLRETLPNIPSVDIVSPKSTLLQKVRNRFDEEERDVDDEFVNKVRSFLLEKIGELVKDPIDLSKANIGGGEVNAAYLYSIYNSKLSAEVVAESILGACLANEFWSGLSTSPFREALALPDAGMKAEKLSILTQFFLAETNIFCYANKISGEDFGQILDNNISLCKELAAIIVTALADNQVVERCLVEFINNKYQEFGMSQVLEESEIKTMIDRFNVEYAMVKDSPHMDEFLLFLPEVKGKFVNHKNRISFHFSHFQTQFSELQQGGFLKEQLDTFSKRDKNVLPHKNKIEEEAM